ncbi:MAG: bile acid:sodium symporter family protein [Planctomycetota bacterium]|jgi:BASS family bile acid:Na+ symporter
MHTVTTVALPVVVFYLMWVVGLELTPDDFRRVLRYPKATLVGTASQLTLVPVVGGLLVFLLKPPPAIAAAVILVAASPGGSISNILTVLARGNPGLSVTLTALSNTIGVITFPLLAAGGFKLLLGGRAEVGIPVIPMMGQLVVLMLFPIGVGMLVRRRGKAFVDRHRSLLQRVSLVLVLGIVALLVIDQRGVFVESVRGVAPLSALFTLITMASGFAIGWLVGLPFRDRATLLMELSVQNTAVAMVISSATLGRLDYTVIIMAYFVVQILVTVIVIPVLRYARR